MQEKIRTRRKKYMLQVMCSDSTADFTVVQFRTLTKIYLG